MENDTEKRSMFKQLFLSEMGQRVLEDIERVANTTKVDGDNPNSNAAIYKTAQLALVQYIKKQTQPQRTRVISTKGN